MSDPVPVNEGQEQPEPTSPPEETTSGTAVPADSASSPLTSLQPVTVAHVAISSSPIVLHVQATVGGTEPASRLFPRAFYPFGWSASDLRRWIALAVLGGASLIFLWLVQ